MQILSKELSTRWYRDRSVGLKSCCIDRIAERLQFKRAGLAISTQVTIILLFYFISNC